MSHPEQSEQMRAAKGNCLEMLRLILDGEASEEEKKDFIDKHLETCMPCYKTYHLEMAIRDLLKSKCGKHEAPAELIENIKRMIGTVR
jgi:anti-sigma factor (TIGR02949 family)